MIDPSDESWGLLALVAAMFFVFSQKAIEKREVRKFAQLPALLTVLIYMLLFQEIPMIFSAALAMLALSFFLSRQYYDSFLKPGICGLMIIALPLISSFQFYLGYPMRLLAAHLTSPLMQLAGFSCHVEGVVIHCNEIAVVVDAPCSGIRMGWVAYFFCYFLSCHYNFNLKKTLLCMTAASVSILLANVIRACSLVHIEMSAKPFPDYFHDLVGLLSFALLAGLLCFFASSINRRTLCSKLSS